jgi:TonB family protein
MPYPRTAKSNVLFVFLVAGAFLISGIVAASPEPGRQQLQLIPPAPQPSQQSPVSMWVEVPKSTGDVNFCAYLRTLMASIRRNILARLPQSTVNGEKGVVVLGVHIQKDGSLLPEGDVIIVSSSGRKDMDAAAQSAIRTAAPFGRLPESYPGSSLDLLFTFSYKSFPQGPTQKPKVVPIGTAVNHIREHITMERP